MSETSEPPRYWNELSRLEKEAVFFWKIRTDLAEAMRTGDQKEASWSLTELECRWLHSGEIVRRRCAKVLDEHRPGWLAAFYADRA